MASNRSNDDFDDFFDTAERTAGDSSNAGKSKVRVSASSERQPGADSDSDFPDQNRQSAKQRSRRYSSRSRDSSFSEDSRSPSPRRRGRRPSDSRSRSSSRSTNSSRSRTYSSDSVTLERETTNKKTKVSNRRDSNLSVDTACTSEDENKHTKPRSRVAACNQGWSTETKSKKSKQVQRDSSPQTSSDNRKTRQGRRDKKYCQVNSDSEVTDVSPMSSPRSNKKKQSETKPPKCISRAPGVQATAQRTNDGGDNSGSDNNALELNLLVKAVSELEKQTREQSDTRRVMFEPSRIRRERKSNYTFSDSDTNRIEHENQRLLRQIMCQMHTMDGRYTGSFGKGKKSVIPASGINRLRDHNRIEKENLAMLRRLQHIKPSRDVSRQEQLSAYHATLLHGASISTLHHPATPTLRARPPSGGQSRAGSEAGSLSRTRSLTSVQSAGTASSVRSANQSRRLRSRPSSAKMSVSERPPWDDRW
ncbi:hypothetical protein ACOMHN_048937 [Nucella lapillus]